MLNQPLPSNVDYLSRGMPRIAADRFMGKDGKDARRVTTTLSRAQKRELEGLALREGVKVAWLIRRAVDVYLNSERGGPLLPLTLETDRAQR